MRKAWLRTITAALSAVAMAGSTALASPAGMAMSNHRSAKSSAADKIEPRAIASMQADPALPSSQISPLRHPVKYMAATVAEMPIGSKAKRGATANPVMPPATRHNDSISLSTPTGPPTPQLFISAAQMCESQKDIAQARGNYQQALSMWPGHVEVLRAAARMEDRLGEMAVAENLYQQAVAANPQHAGALNDLGLCLARQGKLEASLQVIEQAIQLQPDKPLYRNNAATVLVEMRQDQRALSHLAAVHDAADANYNFGQLLVQRGRAPDATPYFQAAVEQDPQLQPAHVALAKLRGQPAPAAASITAPAATPSVPTAMPQSAPQMGPQLTYPGASSYSPPNYYPPSQAFGPANDPRVGAAPPRYLPPVASQPGVMQR